MADDFFVKYFLEMDTGMGLCDVFLGGDGEGERLRYCGADESDISCKKKQPRCLGMAAVAVDAGLLLPELICRKRLSDF